MIATIVAALALAVSSTIDPPAAATPTPVTDEQTPLKDAQDKLERAQQIYQQSCANRAYGAYDDLCEQLSIQMRQIRVDLDKLEREAASKPVKTDPARPKS